LEKKKKEVIYWGMARGGGISVGWFIAILLIIVVGAWYLGYLQIPAGQTVPSPPSQQQPSQTVSVNKPLQFSLMDPLAGQAIGGATIYIYKPDKTLVETVTTSSDPATLGMARTINPYRSGETIYVKIVKSGYVTRWVPVTVPQMSQADAMSMQYNFIPLTTYSLGTYTIKIMDQFGNVYTSGGTLNFTALNAQTVTLSITIYNTKDNSGFISSRDIVNGIDLKAVLTASTIGSSVTVTGFSSSVQRGTTTYYMTAVNDDGLTRQLVGTQYVKPGVTTISITVGKGGLAAGQTQAFTFDLMGYFDPAYFAANGIGGPDAVQLATFSLTFAA